MGSIIRYNESDIPRRSAFKIIKLNEGLDLDRANQKSSVWSFLTINSEYFRDRANQNI